jgi:hypothetical protein
MKLTKYFLAVVCLTSFVSCLKVSDEIRCNGDAMIVSKMSGDKIVHGLSIYAYTNGAFQSVQVLSSADQGKAYTLKADQGVNTNFIYDMPENDYTVDKPVASTYTFTATFRNGTTKVFSDDLTDKVLPIPTFEKCAYNLPMLQIDVAWPAVTGASSYAINVFDGTTPVFWSNELASLNKSFSIVSGGKGWAAGFVPQVGKTYTVRLFAYLFEDLGNINNIQAISFADKAVVWGK